MGNRESESEQQSEVEQKTYLKVANINFSGYESSPFEYFSEEHLFEEQELNDIFQKTIESAPKRISIPQLYNEASMKAISSIDKVIKHERYSPLYYKQCGVKDGKFVDVEEFIRLWDLKLRNEEGWRKLKVKQVKPTEIKTAKGLDKSADKNPKETKDTKQTKQVKQEQNKSTKNEKDQIQGYERYQDCVAAYRKELEQLMGFDFIIYASILRYVYQNSELQSIIQNRACSKYLGFMEGFFSKPYLNNNRKIHQIINFILENQIDVLFVQEATQKLCDMLEKRDPSYRFIMSKERADDPGISIVIFNQKSFKKADIGRKSNLKIQQIYSDNKIQGKIKQNFLMWGKSAFISIDNFILISTHTKQFSEAIENDLKLIMEKFPTKYVIAGGTFSHCNRKYSGTKTGSRYILYPHDTVTCYKKRTNMQFQIKKAGQIVKNQTNCILYDQRLNLIVKKDVFKNKPDEIYNGIFTIGRTEIRAKLQQEGSNKTAQETKIREINFLPNDDHPFDQLIVLKTLKIPLKKKIETEQMTPEMKRKLKEDRERLGFETSSSEEEDAHEAAAQIDALNGEEDEIF